MQHRFGVKRAGVRLAAGILLLSLVAVALAAFAIPRLRGAHSPSTPDYWPTAGWRSSTPEAQGIDSVKLAELVQAIREREVPVHSLLVIRHGYVVIDATFYPYDGQTVHDVASVTKSVMTTLIGIAADQGKLDLDDRMISFFPDRTIAHLDARKDKITVRHLVSMASGLDCTREADELTNREMQASPDFVQFVLDREAVWEPGEHFVYCSPAIHLLSPILQQATDMTALAFAQQYLFQPLGIRAAMWERDPQGYYDGWGDLSLHPHDMAKIGLLFMQRGRWEDEQVVSRAWVEAATKVQAVTPDDSEDPYGYGWWLDPAVEHGYRADGRGGQYIFVLPEWDMVVVTTGGGFEMDEIAELILASFIDFDAPLPANPEGVARLEAAIAAATRAPESGPVAPLPDTAHAISGRTYVFEPNPVQLETLTVAFDGSAEAAFHAEAQGRTVSSGPIGLDGVYRFSPGADGRPVAHRGTWTDAQTFALEYDGVTNNDHSFFEFHFEGDRVEVRLRETARDPGTRFEGRQQAGMAQP
jgi:CubicO group peptidase (beta-lactamase class C family)